VLPEGAGICVAFGAAGDLTYVRFLKMQRVTDGAQLHKHLWYQQLELERGHLTCFFICGGSQPSFNVNFVVTRRNRKGMFGVFFHFNQLRLLKLLQPEIYISNTNDIFVILNL